MVKNNGQTEWSNRMVKQNQIVVNRMLGMSGGQTETVVKPSQAVAKTP
jgi:hypothetical protein